jgi:hypothetical protein
MVTPLQSSSSKQAPKCAAAGKQQQQQDVVLYFGVIDILQVRATAVGMLNLSCQPVCLTVIPLSWQ